MSGIIAVYGLVMAVLIAGSLNPLYDYSLYKYEKSGNILGLMIVG
jgi:hypothetical protein